MQNQLKNVQCFPGLHVALPTVRAGVYINVFIIQVNGYESR